MKQERQNVRNFILLFSSAIFVAFVVVVGLVYYFGASGTYLVNKVLVSPSVLEKGAEPGEEDSFVLSRIEFVPVETKGWKWGQYPVTVAQYGEFYKLIAHERSLPRLSKEQTDQFATQPASALTIFVQVPGGEESIFQQIQFLEKGDLFRIHRCSSRSLEGEWVNFWMPGIYQKTFELFVPALEAS